MNLLRGVWAAAMLALLWAAPWLVARGAVTFARSARRTVSNWRGRRVARVLGTAWLAWAIGVALLQAVLVVTERFPGVDGSAGVYPFDLPVEWSAPLLVAGCFALGLLDDTFGDRTRSGLRGHLDALAKGRFTTGALKMLGIGALALAATSRPAQAAGGGALATFALWLPAAVLVAGTANLVNLADLRPLRAVKLYSALAVTAALGAGVEPGRAMGPDAPAIVFASLLVLFGPVAATWSLEARELGMLGDAGANAAGALAGWWLVLATVDHPVWLWLAAAIAVALNLVSERVSFTEVIGRHAPLRWLDALGRHEE